jgi:hypothetical protein
MVKKAYDPYLKTSFYERAGNRTMEPPLEAKAAPKVEAPKKKWLQISKERKGSSGQQTGRGQKTRKQVFKKSDR